MLASAGTSVALTGGYCAAANKVLSNCFAEKWENMQEKLQVKIYFFT